MRLEHKRQPAFIDIDLMPYGKYKNTPLQDVPANYLVWLWGNIKTYSRNAPQEDCLPINVEINIKIANYIWNSKEAIEQEAKTILL